MKELVRSIETALAEGSTEQQRADGVAACQAILTALDAKPGAPLVPHVATVDPSMALDLIIGKLKAVVAAREGQDPVTTPRGYRVELVPLPRSGE